MTGDQPGTIVPRPSRLPSLIDMGGITTRRVPADGEGDKVTATVNGTGASVTMTAAQAHELIDQLALHLGRPDLVTAHRHQPQRRPQPGRTP